MKVVLTLLSLGEGVEDLLDGSIYGGGVPLDFGVLKSRPVPSF